MLSLCGASRREAAEEFNNKVSASTAIIRAKCFRETGHCTAKPRGGSVSPLEKHADFLLGLIEKQPDLTLDKVVLTMRRHKVRGRADRQRCCTRSAGRQSRSPRADQMPAHLWPEVGAKKRIPGWLRSGNYVCGWVNNCCWFGGGSVISVPPPPSLAVTKLDAMYWPSRAILAICGPSLALSIPPVLSLFAA